MGEEKGQTKDIRPQHSLIEVVTENGFCIARSSDLDEALPSLPHQFCFIVRAPNGGERNIVVGFSSEAIALIQRRRQTPLLPDNSFWISCAERSLAMYLWEKSHLPPGGKLALEEIGLNELEVARQWDDGLTSRTEKPPQKRAKTNSLGVSFYLQSIFVILFLYLIAAFAPKTLAPDLIFISNSLSSFILYATVFLSGTLLGLAMMDLTPLSDQFIVPEMEKRAAAIPPSYDEKGWTPVERVIREQVFEGGALRNRSVILK